jgi:hypothetical protein
MSQIWNHVKIDCGKPKVGEGATVFWYTDRTAATVVRVAKSGKTAWIQGDFAVRADKNGMSESQEYTYKPNPDAKIERVSLRKDGQWRTAGKHGKKVAFGARRAYHDYSF